MSLATNQQELFDPQGRQVHVETQFSDWDRSDNYHNSFLIQPDADLAQALAASQKADLPSIAVSEALGKFLNLQAKAIGAKRVLEVGTLGGYSTIWLAKALPADGEVVTLEVDPVHAEVATNNFAAAGLSSKIKVIVGSAVETLPTIPSSPQFDLAFIDADKENNTAYFQHATRLVRKGGVIIVDNVVRRGRVGNTEVTDDSIEGVRALLRHISEQKDVVSATTIATVGSKGYDGFLYALVL